MHKTKYQEVCSAYRLIMREILAGRNGEARRDAELKYWSAPVKLQKAAQDAYNWWQNQHLHNMYAPCTPAYWGYMARKAFETAKITGKPGRSER